jgi:hypothetical protein
MHNLIPDGPENLWCPDWKKPMSKVCKTCPLWTRVEHTVTKKDGSPPEQSVTWNCAKSQQVIELANIIAGQRVIIERLLGNQSATEGMRNEIIKRMDRPSPAPVGQLDLIEAIDGEAPKLIGGH